MLKVQTLQNFCFNELYLKRKNLTNVPKSLERKFKHLNHLKIDLAKLFNPGSDILEIIISHSTDEMLYLLYEFKHDLPTMTYEQYSQKYTLLIIALVNFFKHDVQKLRYLFTSKLCSFSSKFYRSTINYWYSLFVNLEQTPQLTLVLCKNFYSFLKDFPNLQSKKNCMEAFLLNFGSLQYFDSKYKTPEMALIAVRSYGCYLNDLQDLQSQSICYEAVHQDSIAFRYVNNEFKTKKLCFQSVCRYGVNISYVPLEIFDNLFVFEQFSIAAMHYSSIDYIYEVVREIFLKFSLLTIEYNNIQNNIVQEDVKYINNIYLKIVTEKQKTNQTKEEVKLKLLKFAVLKRIDLLQESFFQHLINSTKYIDVYLAAINHDYKSIRFIDFEKLVNNSVFSNIQVTDILYKIVNKYPFAIQYVHENFQTEELCFSAVKKSPAVFKHIKNTKQFYQKLCMMALRKDSSLFEYLDKQFHSEKLCFKIIYNNPEMIKHVSSFQKFYDKLCLLAVKREGQCIQFVVESFRTKKICLAAVYNDELAIKYVPKQHQTNHICLYAFKKIPPHLKSFSLFDNPSYELCEKILKIEPRMFSSLKDEFKTQDLCSKMVRENGDFLRFIPFELQTLKMCQTAVYRNPIVFQYASDELKNNDELIKLALKLCPKNLLHVNKSKLLKYLNSNLIREFNHFEPEIIVACINTKLDESDIAKLPIKTLSYSDVHLKYAKLFCKCSCMPESKQDSKNQNKITEE